MPRLTVHGRPGVDRARPVDQASGVRGRPLRGPRPPTSTGRTRNTDTAFTPATATATVQASSVAAYDGKLHVVHRGGGLVQPHPTGRAQGAPGITAGICSATPSAHVASPQGRWVFLRRILASVTINRLARGDDARPVPYAERSWQSAPRCAATFAGRCRAVVGGGWLAVPQVRPEHRGARAGRGASGRFREPGRGFGPDPGCPQAAGRQSGRVPRPPARRATRDTVGCHTLPRPSDSPGSAAGRSAVPTVRRRGRRRRTGSRSTRPPLAGIPTGRSR